MKKTRKKRQLKSDNVSRDYKCGCGRSYLSYPALYTHIKTKHGGDPPPGTTKQIKQRGRPSFKDETKINFET